MMTKKSRLTYEPLQLRHRLLNRWLVSEIAARAVRFEPMTMEGDINDWLIKGFSIHENPCRKQFVERRRSAVPELPFASPPSAGDTLSHAGGETEWNVYFPWGNPRVEESGFYYVPTHMIRYACTVVVSPSSHKAAFNLRTCGGVALWANGRLVCDFTPFTRNIEQTTQVEVQLEAGENTLIVCHEDLAERDTLYHFTLEYTGEERLELHIPVADEQTAEAVAETEDALAKAYFPRDSFADADIRLTFEKPLGRDVAFDVSNSHFFGGKHTVRRVLKSGETHLTLGHTDDFGIHYEYFELKAYAGKAAIRKLYGAELYNSRFQPKDGSSLTAEQRKRIALECVAKLGSPNIHTAVAKLKTGGSPGETRKMLMDGLAGIAERRDCADFYLIALFRLWRDYRESGAFDEAFWAEVKRTVVGFRYWIDEPGDDVMWFFSENHALLFHSCQLLAGQLFPDDLFPNSGESGAERRQKAEDRLTAWFGRFFAEGLAEWNSSAYIPIDVLGLVHLHDLAESAELRGMAKRALDLLFYYMAAEAHGGYLAATFGRSYEKELLGHRAAGTTSLIWAGYGAGNVNSASFNVPLYLSGYVPPQEYGALTRLQPDEELEFRLEQGKDGYAKLYHYRTSSFAMSSISDFRAGLKGYQEHVLHLALSHEAQVWINHPGEIYAHGSGRPCFWAGNGVLPKAGQYKGLGFLLFDADPAHDADYTHAYFPTGVFTRVEERSPWFFGEKDGVYAAVYAAGGLRLTQEGTNRGRELVSPGYRNIWIVRASDRREFGSFERFAERMLSAELRVSVRELDVRLADPVYGEARFAWRDPLTVNGKRPAPIDGCGVKGRLERSGRADTCN